MGRIRACWAVLADTSTLDRPARTARPPAGPDRLAYLDATTAHDRAHRYLLARDGRAAFGATPAPARPLLLDARAMVDREVCAAATEAYRAASPEHVGWRHPAQHTDGRVLAALGLLAGLTATRGQHRPALPAELAAALADRLIPVAGAAEHATGHVPLRVPVPGVDCPTCGLRSLRVRQDSTDPGEWVAECRTTGCVCRGRDCPCAVLDRIRGRRHVWLRDEWPTLAAV